MDVSAVVAEIQGALPIIAAIGVAVLMVKVTRWVYRLLEIGLVR